MTPPVLGTVTEVTDLVGASGRSPLYVRFGHRDDDLSQPSIDHVTGLALPGLSVNPLCPPSWWSGRPLDEWVVRQISTYAHLAEHDPDRVCLVLTGRVVDRGPDNEPLLDATRVVAEIAASAVDEATSRAERSPRPEDASVGAGAPWQD